MTSISAQNASVSTASISFERTHVVLLLVRLGCQRRKEAPWCQEATIHLWSVIVSKDPSDKYLPPDCAHLLRNDKLVYVQENYAHLCKRSILTLWRSSFGCENHCPAIILFVV